MRFRSPVVVLVAVCVVAGSLGSDLNARASSAYSFPLWKDVPGNSFAVLGKGRLRGMEWAVFASRGSGGPKSRSEPCITVARLTEGRYANALSCGPLAPTEGIRYPPSHPLLGEVEATAFGISVAREISAVDIELEKGRSIKHIRDEPRLLSRRQAKKARLPQFRYVAVAVPYAACIIGIVGYSASGEKRLDFKSRECRNHL